MEQKVIKHEIEIDDDFIWNTNVKQEASVEMPHAAFTNMNTSTMHPIKQEICDDLKTTQGHEESMVTVKAEGSCNTVDKFNIQNKMEYMGIKNRKPIKSQSRIDMEQTVIKDEIEIHDDFIWNMNVKQELCDEMPNSASQNVNTCTMHPIKQEISHSLKKTQGYDESTVTVKTEESCNTVDKLNIQNKMENVRIKTRKPTKSREYKMTYHWCIVPECTNTSIKTPNKVFVQVPREEKRRKQWFQAIRRDYASIKPGSPVFVCEDHFNLETDLENYMMWKLTQCKKILKKTTVPTKFDCQKDRKRALHETPRPLTLKRQKNDVIEEHLSTSTSAGYSKDIETSMDINITK
ncbi:uncharacterized protein LOC130895485 isoform X3 [Diorhabda carinulata]|uniref:uncharacterized protein LOC130895485 isoform X3 n=1 Tax=Diorhabda carinulata TaxID=1163345 RepID=UPI0025A0E0A8|nr:uncharacterized protein LOC130895485 isoform X3 [Diorhabda carinulata]